MLVVVVAVLIVRVDMVIVVVVVVACLLVAVSVVAEGGVTGAVRTVLGAGATLVAVNVPMYHWSWVMMSNALSVFVSMLEGEAGLVMLRVPVNCKSCRIDGCAVSCGRGCGGCGRCGSCNCCGVVVLIIAIAVVLRSW